MSVATSRMTIGALLGTVTTAATTVTSTLDTASAAVGMLNATVTKAAKEQSIRHAVDVNEFKNRLVVEVSMQRAQRERAVVTFCEDKVNKQLYEAAHNELTALIKEL